MLNIYYSFNFILQNIGAVLLGQKENEHVRQKLLKFSQMDHQHLKETISYIAMIPTRI